MPDPDYFTLAEFRNLPDMDDATAYPDAAVEATAAAFVTIVEREVGFPMVPRTVVHTLDGGNDLALMLPTLHVRSITSVTVDDETVDVSGLSAQYGFLKYVDGTRWGVGVGNITVTYVAGEYAECPADVKDAVMWAVRDRLLSRTDTTAIDVRKTSATNEFGGTVNYVLPGEKRPTGYPELDAVIASYVRNSPSVGIA